MMQSSKGKQQSLGIKWVQSSVQFGFDHPFLLCLYKKKPDTIICIYSVISLSSSLTVQLCNDNNSVLFYIQISNKENCRALVMIRSEKSHRWIWIRTFVTHQHLSKSIQYFFLGGGVSICLFSFTRSQHRPLLRQLSNIFWSVYFYARPCYQLYI